MSGAVTTAIVGGVATAAVMSVLSPKQPNPGQPPAPIPPPQGVKQPDQAAIRRQGTGNNVIAGGGIDGTPAGTLLTGPGGVDSEKLKLGKNSALGA